MKSIQDKIQEVKGQRRLVAKVVCILLAVILWAFISSSKSGTVKFKVPIKERNLPNYAVATEISKRFVIVSFEGRKDNIKNVNIKNINAYVDLRKPKIGKNKKYRVIIDPQQIPEGITISQSIRSVNILVERKIEKQILVIPQRIGNVKKGYVMGSMQVIPNTVKISGPQNVVDKINYVYTDEFSIEGEDTTFEKVVPISSDNKNKFKIHETNVKVIIPIVEYKHLSKIKVPIMIINRVKGFNYELSESSTTIFYQSSGYINIKDNSLNANSFEVTVDVGKINLESLITEDPEQKKEFVQKEVEIEAVLKDNTNKSDIVSSNPGKVLVKVRIAK